jgi:hypothetical protein
MKPILFVTVLVLTASLLAADDAKVPVADVVDKALQQSQLTWPGSKPFHITATIFETTDPGSEPRAKIVEDWVSPSKWRRTIESPEFTQTRIVNGDAIFEKNTGDYFPAWLDQMVTAIFDPVPMLSAFRNSNAQMPKVHAGANSNTCADFPMRIDRWVICFEGSHGLLSSIFTKGYGAEFKDYEKFGDKRVAHRISRDFERGTTFEVRIDSLGFLDAHDESIFAIPQPTPPAERITRMIVSDDTVRKLSMDSTDIAWPAVGQGILKGGCAVYISADRSGQIREVWPAGCDNAALQGPLHDAVMKWHLKPAVANGIPVQIESLMGFGFQTTLDSAKTPPLLTDKEARDLAKNIVEPRFPPNSSYQSDEIIARISVDDTGKFTGIENTHHLSTPVLLAISEAVKQWTFQPYVHGGKPQEFHADLVFQH